MRKMPARCRTSHFPIKLTHVFRLQLYADQHLVDPRGHGADSAQAEPGASVEGRLAGGRRYLAGSRHHLSLIHI